MMYKARYFKAIINYLSNFLSKSQNFLVFYSRRKVFEGSSSDKSFSRDTYRNDKIVKDVKSERNDERLKEELLVDSCRG